MHERTAGPKATEDDDDIFGVGAFDRFGSKPSGARRGHPAMRVCVCVRARVCMYVCARVCSYTSVGTGGGDGGLFAGMGDIFGTHVYAHVHAHADAFVHTHVHIHAHVRVHVHVHTRSDACLPK